jgi:hypothetical protein
MQHSDQPFREIAKAKEALAGMMASHSVEHFEEHWKEFLRRLERSWSKAQAHFGKSPKWNGWQGRIQNARRADPLLAYLVNARGAEEHTVNEISSRQPGGIGVNPAVGSSLYIERMEINNGVISIRSPQQLKIEFVPSKMSLLPVVNRGRTYPLPTLHLGAPIDPSNVVAVAQSALAFYENALNEAEEFFVK